MIEMCRLGPARSRPPVALLVAAVAAFLVFAPSAEASEPTVTINQAAGQSDPTSGSQVLFTVTFSQPVGGFTGSDVDLSASTAGTLAASVSAVSTSVYTVTVTGMTHPGIVRASIPAHAAQNLASELSRASTSTDNTVTWNEPHPAVIINQAAGQSDPTSGSSIEFSVAFSTNIVGFDANDVDLSASTAGGTLIAAVLKTGTEDYTVTVTGMTSAGTVVASIPAGAATDTEGHPSAASISTDHTVSWTPAHPTVTINQAAGQSDPTSGSQIQFTATFSESVTGFTASDVNLTGSTAGGTLIVNVSGGPTVYTVTVSGMTSVGTVVASIPTGAAHNGASQSSLASTSTDNTVTWDPSAGSGSGGSGGGETGGGGSGGGSSGGGAPPTLIVAPAPTPSVTLLSTCRAKHPCATDRKGKVLRLRVACSAAAPCTGQAAIVLKKKTLGKASFKLAAGARTTLRVRLRSSATRLLTSKPKLSAKLDVVLGSTSTAFPLTFALPTPRAHGTA